MHRLELPDPAEDLLEAQGLRVVHRPAPVSRESVAVDVDDVDVGRALGDAFAEDLRALVHEREDAPVDDLGVGDLPLLDPILLRAAADDLLDHRSGTGNRLPASYR